MYKYTALQSSFSVNNICLVKGRPQLLNLRGLISNFVEHRHDVVTRRTQYDLRKAQERAHILQGLIIAIDNLDAVIELIRASATPEEARNNLMGTFEPFEVQARAILDMRLQKLTGLERDKLRAEYDEAFKRPLPIWRISSHASSAEWKSSRKSCWMSRNVLATNAVRTSNSAAPTSAWR